MGLILIIERELRLAARRPITYYSRMLAGAIVLAISLSMLFVGFTGILSANSAGRSLFVTLSLASFLFLLFEGSLLTADCLSQEKREGTLGLLFLTDLTGPEVIIGKLSARLLNSAYCLVATLPAPSMAIFLGGVSFTEIGQMLFALLNTLFWAGAVGMLISTLLWSETATTITSVTLAFLFGLLIPGLGLAWATLYPGSQAYAICGLLSPASMIAAVLEYNPANVPQFSYLTTWVTTHVVAWVALILAGVLIPASWQGGLRKATWRSLTELARKARKIKLFDESREANPVLWLALHKGVHKSWLTWALGIGAVLWLYAWKAHPGDWIAWPVFFISVVLMHLLLTIDFSIEACRLFRDDRGSGALELLLTTPLDADTLVQGKLLGFKRRGFTPLGCVLLADTFLVTLGFYKFTTEVASTFLVFALFLTAQLAVQLYVASWVGLRYGLVSRTSAQAIRQTLLEVVLVPWIIIILTFGAVALCTQGQAARSPGAAVGAVLWYILVLVGSAAHSCGRAMVDLRENLRAFVSVRSS